MRSTLLQFRGWFLCLLPLTLMGCGSEKTQGPLGPEGSADDGYFESAASGQAGPGRGAGGAAASADAPGLNVGEESAADGDAPERVISEADIIQLQGSTLYAMSRSGGLSVIDVSKPAALKILGRYRTSFTPFEMYVRDGIVFAMYSDWGYFVEDEATQQWSWKQSSSLLALDVSKPASIQKLAQFDLPGEISDSRLVGDVLYAVSYQNGSCWQCATKPATNVVAIDVSQPSKPLKVDELAFETDGNEYGWGKRSISVTTDRIYVAGPEYGQAQPENSTIQVVDISDPKGGLEAGTTVKIKGQITSRWQMDETDGVLRVISQPWTWWNNSVAPALETFRVSSSQKIEKLAHLDITLPRPESLQSVRFDGPRGYAVTFERKDPLFTFDLSDPAAPKQMGELEMPGFLYHMEPRGDRLIGLGFDQGNAEGAITVSIFDVTDLAKPSMIQRVNFGGDWAYLAEDQDRIHKLFKLDEENGLMLVPFSGWKTNQAKSCGTPLNGVQLIDWAGDSLALRGMAPSTGQARRAFMLKDTLFTIAEEEVAAFDLTNRDQPKEISQAPLALNVSLTLPTGDKLVRLRRDWYGADMRLEVVPRATPDALVAAATFNLTEYLREKHGLQDCGYWYPTNEPLFAVGDVVWAVINDYGQWNYDGVTKARSLLVGFSSETGVVTGSLALPFQPGYWGYSNTSRIVRGSTALLMQEGQSETGSTRTLAAIDLSDPSAPRLAKSLPLPADDYSGSVGMLESGNELITSYARSVPNKPNVVRHFALRLDISEPLEPTLAGIYNVPGYVIDFNAKQASAVTLDHQPIQTQEPSVDACYAQGIRRWFDGVTGICHGYQAQLHRVALGSSGAQITASLRNDELAWSTPRRAEGRLFFTSNYYGYYGGIASDVGYYGGWSWSSLDVTVVSSDTLAYSKIKAPGVWNSLPSGQSLILAPSAGQPLTVIDASDVNQPKLRETTETALGYTSHMSLVGNTVYLSQNDGGVQTLSLPSTP